MSQQISQLYRVRFCYLAYGQELLFDSGASHSFIAASVVIKLGLEVRDLRGAFVCEFSPRD